MTRRMAGMTKLAAVAVAVFLYLMPLMAGTPAEQGDLTVTVIQTSDIHGHVLPWDYFQERPMDLGLARVAGYVRQLRQEGDHVILIDDGDTIQGTPLSYYYEKKDLSRPNPMMSVMNAMKYDAMTVGNHEYNYGMDVLLRCRKEANFPFLSANTYKRGEEKPFFKPYIIKEINGVRIGIIGLTTPNIPNWETPANYDSLVFRDSVEEARKWVRVLRDQEHVQAVIINTHEGFEVDLDSGKPNGSRYENHSWAIAHDVPGVDVLLTGHAHQNITPRLVNGVLVSEPGRWGEYLTRIDLLFRKENGHWQLVGKTGENIRMDSKVPEDSEVVDLIRPYDETVRQWVDSRIGEAGGEFTTTNVYTQDNALMDLLQQVLRTHTGADMSMISYLPHRFVSIPKGPITVRDIYKFYLYENTPVVLAMKGRDIRAALEHAAEFYDSVEWNSESQRMEIHQNKNFRSYNFDTLSGADYAIDPTRPVGQRVVYLEKDGLPLDPDREYTVAVTNYQAAGGGSYSMFKKSRVVSTDSADIRNLMIEYIQEKGMVMPECDHNWGLQFNTWLVFPRRQK